jgi:hypothetical protein
VRLAGAEEPGIRLSASLAGSVEGSGIDETAVRLTIVPDQPGNQHVVEMTERGAPDPQMTFFGYSRGSPEDGSCPELPCARTYRVIVELVDDGSDDAVEVSFRAQGEVSVHGPEQMPAGVAFSVDPVDELLLVERPPEIHATSEAQDARIGGQDRQDGEVHAVISFEGHALPATASWPVVPELIMHVEPGDGPGQINAGYLVLRIERPEGSSPPRIQWVHFTPEQLPYGVTMQPIPGCHATPCSIALDATLGAQSPGDPVPLRWWVEARVRYFDAALAPAGAGIKVRTLSAEEHLAGMLEICADEPHLVLGEAYDRQIISEEELWAQLGRSGPEPGIRRHLRSSRTTKTCVSPSWRN